MPVSEKEKTIRCIFPRDYACYLERGQVGVYKTQAYPKV